MTRQPKGGPPSEHREGHRVPVRLEVCNRQGSVPVGETRDLSLEGFFLAMDSPPPADSRLPLLLSLPDGKPPMSLTAEVARHSDGGAGFRFVDLNHAQQHRLRGVVGELCAADGTRSTVLAAHASASDGQALSGDDARDLLDRAASAGTEVTLIPTDRPERHAGRLVAQRSNGQLELHLAEPGVLKRGESILVLLTLDFVSWSFDSRVRSTRGSSLGLPGPERVFCSERRSTDRLVVAPDTVLAIPRPWDPKAELRWPVCERGPGGLSVRADPASCSLVPGAPLPEAVLRSLRDGVEPLQAAVVRHLTLVQEDNGDPWVKVGLSYGAPRQAPQRGDAAVAQPGLLGAFAGRVTSLVAGAWNRVVRPLPGEGSAFRQVRFPSRRGLEIAGLLNRTPQTDGQLEAPLVILLPGYGHRKERLSGLATTLVDGFARQGHPLAVLRIDGTNNLGQSGKDPGCEGEGHHTKHYTVGGAADDLLSALDWARNNPWVDPTEIVLVSQSFGSVGARHALAGGEAPDIGLWISYMGAADAQHAVLHVSGHVDILGNHRRGLRNGTITLAGCMVDGDRFCEDAIAIGASNLEDARRDMGKIQTDVVWIVGEHDAWIDPRRVEDILSVAAPGLREVVLFEGGHLPSSGEQAAQHFQAIASRIHRFIHTTPLPARPPLARRLNAAAEPEWALVRRADLPNRRDFWRTYLLGEGTLGFDVLALAEPYRAFLRTEADLLAPAGLRVLDLGAGTGNALLELQSRRPLGLEGADLVPEALARARARVGEDVPLQALDIDGSPGTALRRWMRGELTGLQDLGRRIPGLHTPFINALNEAYNPTLHAALRGGELDAFAEGRAAGLSALDAEIFSELALLCRVAAGRVDRGEALARLERLPAQALPEEAGLPWRDGRFDGVLISLVLSYLRHPEDTLSEASRILAPGGRLVVSSMRRGSDMSRLFLDLIETLERCDDADLPDGSDRQELLGSARAFADSAAQLYRLEEEGLFRFYSGEELLSLVRDAGFLDAELCEGFGDPPQAVIVSCRRP